MKNLAFVLILLLLVNTLSASDIVVKSELKSVKVFLSGAELTHSVAFVYPQGDNTIVVSGLANNIDLNSLNIKPEGDFLILETKISKDYLLEKEKSDKIKVLEDSLEILGNDIDMANAGIEVNQSQIGLILANQNLGTDTKAPSIAEIKKMQEFYEKELTSLHKDILVRSKKVKKLKEIKDKIKRQLDEINNYRNNGSSEIIISVSASQKGKGSIELKYFTREAGWQPAYDVRVSDINSPVSIIQKGVVWQNTGVDWKAIETTLSTGNPSLGSYIPELRPWHLDFYRNYGLQKSKSEFVNLEMMEDAEVTSAAPRKPGISADYVTVVQNQLTYEFVTPIKYTILSDNKKHTVMLQNYQIDAEYSYYTAPKLSSDAFLTANIKDWGDNPMLTGEANVFFENAFVGTTTLSPNDSQADIKIALGRDSNVKVKRELSKDYSEGKFLSSDVERKYVYKFTIKNYKSVGINLVLEDQVPLSNQEEIEVNVIDTDGAAYDKETGKLAWTMKINPGDEVRKNLSFSVGYPGDKRIQGL
jgi:uncharacterized protein (TIGR02231 family)